MRDPKVKLAVLLCLIIGSLGLAHAVYFFLIHPQELVFKTYAKGLASVGGATGAGFFLVWLATRITSLKIRTFLGFKETLRDEAGTAFSFPVHLSKYTPDVVAPPLIDNAHPLEIEIFGFLNSFRRWPFDPNNENAGSLYQVCLYKWEQAKNLPPLHRIIILAEHLNKTEAYVEQRTTAPYWMFWKKDEVSYQLRNVEHGGTSAFILSSFPSFKKLQKEEQRAVLVALKFNGKRPPSNRPPLADELMKTLSPPTPAASIQQKAEKVDDMIAQVGEGIYEA